MNARHQSGTGGWITQYMRQDSLVHRGGGTVDTAARAVAGLPPTPTYRIQPMEGADNLGSVRVTVAPGLAAQAVGAMVRRDMHVDLESSQFEVEVAEQDCLWKTLTPVLAGADGPVREDDEKAWVGNLGATEQSAVVIALDAAGVAHQVTSKGVMVEAQHGAALRRAVAMAVTGAAENGSRVRFTLSKSRATAALVALDRAGIGVDAVGGTLQAVVRLQGEQAADAAAAREKAGKVRSAMEKEVLDEKPGYYRNGDRYVVVRPGHPTEETDQPPASGVYLGEWGTVFWAWPKMH